MTEDGDLPPFGPGVVPLMLKHLSHINPFRKVLRRLTVKQQMWSNALFASRDSREPRVLHGSVVVSRLEDGGSTGIGRGPIKRGWRSGYARVRRCELFEGG